MTTTAFRASSPFLGFIMVFDAHESVLSKRNTYVKKVLSAAADVVLLFIFFI